MRLPQSYDYDPQPPIITVHWSVKEGIKWSMYLDSRTKTTIRIECSIFVR